MNYCEQCIAIEKVLCMFLMQVIETTLLGNTVCVTSCQSRSNTESRKVNNMIIINHCQDKSPVITRVVEDLTSHKSRFCILSIQALFVNSCS